MTKTILSLVTAATLALTLQACGDGGRPSKDELVDVFGGSDGITGDVADCIAQGLLDSDLSDDQLRAIADEDEGGLSGDERDSAIEVITEVSGTCATDGLELPDLGDVETPAG